MQPPAPHRSIYYLGKVLIAAAGWLLNPIAHCFLLFDIIIKNPTCR
jgi:hypothetical protein